jgi:hypothetical protein
MPGRFTNTSGNNVARFRVVTGNGRGNFYNPTTTTTTTSTTTTTTTGVQVWYTLERCDDNAIIIYSTNYNTGTFAINDIVVYGGALYFRVIGVNSSNPGGTQLSVSATGLPSCPTTTTTTTTIPPLTLTNGTVTCTGNSGSWTSTFSGGSGTYVTAALATQQSFVGNLLGNGTGGGSGSRVISLSPGDTSYNWTGVGSGSWYVGVKDSAGVARIVAVSVDCVTTTTTTTSTTTTTTTAGIYSTVYLTTNDGAVPCSAGGSNSYIKKALIDTITNETIIYNINNSTWIPGAGATQIVQWTDGTFTTALTNVFNFNGSTGTVGSDTGVSC